MAGASSVASPPASAAAMVPAVPTSYSAPTAASLGARAAAKEQAPRLRGRSDDLNCLTQAVYYEARGEPVSGQAAVAQVVLNRVHSHRFPSTVCGVVFQHSAGGCQFSFACDGARKQPIDRTAWLKAGGIAGRALGGFVMRQVGDATQFQSIASGRAFAGGVLEVARVGAHAFYRLAHGKGAMASATAEAGASLAQSKGATQPTLAVAAAQAGAPTAAASADTDVDGAPAA